MIDIEKLKQAALAATQGEWSSYNTIVYLPNVYGGFDLHDSPNPVNNAAYIATANPSAVLELIERLEAAEKDAARWRAVVAEAERDYVEVSTSEEPYWQRLECTAAMEEFADAAINALETLGNQVAMDSYLLDKIDNELEPVEYTGSYVEGVRALKQKVVEQAAVIEKLRGYLNQISKMSGHVVINNTCTEALAIPTDSTKVLQEWLDKKLGEPVGYQELFDAIAAGTKPYAGSGINATSSESLLFRCSGVSQIKEKMRLMRY